MIGCCTTGLHAYTVYIYAHVSCPEATALLPATRSLQAPAFYRSGIPEPQHHLPDPVSNSQLIEAYANKVEYSQTKIL
jgi:hypothetical protein